MDKAKEEIAKNLGGGEGAYKEIWSIIDAKWDFQMHRHLHAAAYFLNPYYQYDDDFSTHPEVKVGLLTCMTKLYPDPRLQEKIDLQMDAFRRRKGLFGFEAAKRTCKKRSPVDWWLQYGDETPELQGFAVRILSLTCSSSACERNWSTFNQIHTKKRNRLSTIKLNKLVYVLYNKRLKLRWLKKASLKEDDDPLLLDYLPSDDEWIVDEDSSGATGSSGLTVNLDDILDDEFRDDVDGNEGSEDADFGRDRSSRITRGRGRGRGYVRGQKRKIAALG
ncbi:hypothetical protein OROGR_030339 [Orobanche gracilis]